MEDTPHKGHRERLKERFRQEGLEHFEDHTALELLLFTHMLRTGRTHQEKRRLMNVLMMASELW